jgi:NCAIR mutase (PurE)-related protein
MEEARLDFGRRSRLGMVEAVWGENKTPEQIGKILRRFHAEGEFALVTRIAPAKVDVVRGALKDLPLQHHPEARGLTCPALPAADPRLGWVAVLSGGTSDLPVAAEAQLALACHRVASRLVLDVGVAGLHRLLDQLADLSSAAVLIVCAGMEGSLPTVVAGLLPQPVIAVPVAVGYGVSAGGAAALHSMLASCAPGLTVVNIDNGFGAAMAALRILQAQTRFLQAGIPDS